MDQCSCWSSTRIYSRPNIIVGPIYRNYLSENLTTNAKRFADDTSFLLVAHDVSTSAKELNNNLKEVNDWIPMEDEFQSSSE